MYLHTTGHVVKMIDLMAATHAHRATKYIDERTVVRVTRTQYRSKFRGAGKPRTKGFARDRFEVTVTAGRPNYRERKFIKTAKKAGCRFPISKIQLQY